MKKHYIQVNLKRFDIPSTHGGICTNEQSHEWLRGAIQQIIDKGWGANEAVELNIFVPELLLMAALDQVARNDANKTLNLKIGSQSCHLDDVAAGGNFGAFTTHALASGQSAVGAKATIIGHCEERNYLNALFGMVAEAHDDRQANAVSEVLAKKAIQALKRDMAVTLCIGETADQRGNGDDAEQVANAKAVLEQQLKGLFSNIDANFHNQPIVIAYEPIWAIGPGKTPPSKAYIAMISGFIKSCVAEHFSIDVPVIYGGGLKEENSKEICSIDTIDGGLIALTQFTPPIGFYADGFDRIVTRALAN